MKFTAICLAILGCASGIIAAYYWHQSSKIAITPGWVDFEPVETEDKALGWTVGTLEAFTRSATLNRKAAIWTFVSVFLAATSGIMGSLL